MPDASDVPAVPAPADPREAYRRQFAEDFAVIWESGGLSGMDARVLGYLMIMNRPFISSTDLADALGVSAGAVSMSTRRLIETNFIRRHSIPGDRRHYYKAHEDPWGSFLATERRYIDRETRLFEAAVDWLEPGEEDARVRLVNGYDYLRFGQEYHHKMLEMWEERKRVRDARPE